MSALTAKRQSQMGALVPAKKAKQELALTNSSNSGALVQKGPPRTSGLLAPIMLLTGHEGEICCAKFHPEGELLASAGYERLIFLWTVYGECDNYHVIKGGHKGAIVELQFNTDGKYIFTASTDKTVGMFDSETGEKIKRMKGHDSIVNSCASSRRGDQLVASGSDDCTVKVWDVRRKGAVKSLQSTYQVTSVTFNDTAQQIMSGGIDNDIKVWDIRNEKSSMSLRGHKDTITGLSLSADGSFLLSNSMDNTLRMWDVRPYAPQERCMRIFSGHQHNFEMNLLRCSWSPDGSRIAAGSANRFVHVWDARSSQLLYKLPGHAGCVNEVSFHPKEPIIMSCSMDKQIYLGELQ
ncbi:U5 small nuclear ribonucleoprotein 40 kDa protein-like [Styela clava]